MVYLHPLALLIAAGYASAGQVTPTPAPALLKRQEAVEPAQAQGIGAFFVTEGSSAGDVFTASSSISAPSLANTQGAAAEGVSEEGASATEGGAESETATETNEENGSEGTAEATESAEQDGEQQKQEEGGGGGDATVLQFAGLLEQLETQFYQEALQGISIQQWQELGISGAQANLIAQTLQQISDDEADHTAQIASGLGAAGASLVKKCNFQFGQATKDPLTFLATARSLELAGTSAYLGGAPLLQDKSILNTAATIATIEGRHQTLLNLFSGAEPTNAANDIPLSTEQVLALAGGFLEDCSAEDFGLQTNQPLLAIDAQTGSGVFQIGSQIALASTVNLNADTDSCQMIAGGAVEAQVFPIENCVIPNDIRGPMAVYVTSDSIPLAGDPQLQKKEAIKAGPALVFVDQVDNAAAGVFQSVIGIQQLGSANVGLFSMGGKGPYQVGDFQVGMDQVLSQDKVMVKPEGGDMLEVSRDSSGAITKRDTVHRSKRQRRRHAWH